MMGRIGVEADPTVLRSIVSSGWVAVGRRFPADRTYRIMKPK